ncbi:hypothetical protein KAX29_05090, partial [candidate division WOR-3 bacterium]|nr:hypothetical protein [candidate division WOR-3 bacterium]
GSGTWVQDTALSPVLLPNATMDWLRYGVSYDYLSTAEWLEVGIKYYDGATWAVAPLVIYSADTVSVCDSVDVSAYSGYDRVQIYFYYDDADGWKWYAAFDNLTIDAEIYVPDHDVGVSAVMSPPEGRVGTGDYDVIGSIHNYGSNPETFDVTAIVYDTTDAWNLIFTEAITLTDFPAGADSSHNFGTVNFADDKVFYTEIYTQLIDDDPGNDTASIYSRTKLYMGDVIFEMDVETPAGCNRLLGVEFDGTYFYVTGACATPGNSVYVIDTLGNLIWAPLQNTSTSWGWRDIAWDDIHTGTDRIDTLYASDENGLVKFGIDLTTGALTNYGTIAGPVSPCRGLAWKGDSSWFFTANWSSPVFKFSKTNPKIDSTLNTYSIYGSAYDTDTLEGGWVWWHSQDDPGTGFDCMIEKFDPLTMSFTGDTFGYVPTILTGGMAGGLCFYEDFRGMDVLFALVQGDPVDAIIGIFVRWEGPSGIDEYTEEEAKSYLSVPMSIGKSEIRFTYNGEVSRNIIVVDITGRIVERYDNVRPGTALRFGRNGISSGIYFISVEGSRRSSKVTLIR